MICYLDTQVVVWLCQRQLDKFTAEATAALEQSELLISPMVLLELQYLYQIKRIIQPPPALLNQLEAQIGLTICNHPFPAVVHTALLETWTSDPFDRVIVAHAKSNGFSPLLTPDSKIRDHYSSTVW